MNFPELLGQYMETYSLTVSSLAADAELSPATISRFRSGKREPLPDSETLRKLASGIALSAGADISPENIYAELVQTLKTPPIKFDRIAANLNLLIDTLNINVNNLSRFLNFDASYLSRIRSGQRRPADILTFCGDIARYIASHSPEWELSGLTRLIGCSGTALSNPMDCQKLVMEWLLSGMDRPARNRQEETTLSFLQTLDTFDLSEYIGNLASSAAAKNPAAMPADERQFPENKDYSTLSGFKQAELDWMRITFLSSSDKPIVSYSDMPMVEMSRDPEFYENWMSGMALLMKKGLHLNIIHSVDRSFTEMMLGLTGWIPLYMTGQVSPYYLQEYQDSYFHHFLRTSGAAALAGEAIAGFHANGLYHLTREADGLAYYQKRAENLLSKASPLLEIYRQDTTNSFHYFLQRDFQKEGLTYRNVLSAPPLYTMSFELLNKILERHCLDASAYNRITGYFKASQALFSKSLASGAVTDLIPLLSEDEFSQNPVLLPLADLFSEHQIRYGLEEYREHLRLTEDYAAKHPSYQCLLTKKQPFRNIQIRMAVGECVVISKSKSPAIHFVIRHPKLRQAIEHMTFAADYDSGNDRAQ